MNPVTDADGWRLGEDPSPSPWTHAGGRVTAVYAGEPRVVAVTEWSSKMPDPVEWPEDGDVMAANGRLMAAAPELRSALRVLLGFAATHDGDGCQDADESRWADLAMLDLKAAVEKAREALKKAEGR